MNKQFFPRSGNIAKGGVTHLAQVTTKTGDNDGVRRDYRLEERRLEDGSTVYALMAYTIVNTLNQRAPVIPEEIRVYTYEELALVTDMCGQVLNILESGDRRLLPLNLTVDRRAQRNG